MWSLYKSILNGGVSSTLGPLKDGDIIVTNDLEKANLLNNSFISQTILDDKNALLLDLPSYCNHLIDQKVVSAIDVYKVLNGLDVSKATSPDNISNKLLKEASVPIAEPLSHLFNFFLSLATFPDAWKLANVITIFKKGILCICTNYCPISLLCCISKVLEKIFDHIYAYLKYHGILSKQTIWFHPR